MIRRSGSLGVYYASSGEFAGAGCGSHSGRSVIARGGHLRVAAGFTRVRNLRGYRGRVLFARISFLFRTGTRRHSAFAAVKRNVGFVVDDDFAINVDIGERS